MVFATLLGGVFFYAVHFFASKMPQDEYGVFNALLQVLNQMAIPGIGLQVIFAKEAAMAENEQHRRELVGAIRSVFQVTFFLWLGGLLLVFFFRQKILADYKITSPVALWATASWGLLQLWTPVTTGVLQGRQNFLWVGWLGILGAFSRLVLVACAVMAMGFYAAGATVGVLLSMVIALAAGLWQTRQYWRGAAATFYWLPWLKRVLPLTLGAGATTFMFSWDMIAAQRFLSDTGIYGAAGMIGRALMYLVAPMTAVMFPKIVRSAARAERTDVLAQALGATALLAGGEALFCTFFAELPLKIVQGSKYLAAAPLVPWFAWCMLPLSVSSVLVNNLLARQRYAVVPWLVLVAAAYGSALWFEPFHSSHVRVVQTLGVFALLFLAVCLWFTWRKSPKPSD
jgi:O-antigen/teichoic acid export membrane protein